MSRRHMDYIAWAFVGLLLYGVGKFGSWCDKVTDHQARQWRVTLDQEHRQSGQPWRVEISATSYETARKTAVERLQWHDKGFSVSPVVDNYLDVRHMELTP